MKAKEKISVIIPAYNIKNYILNAVQSIVNQSYDNIEVIIIDDGSSDGTETIIDELTVNKRIRVFHKENEGVAKARMEGVLHATGEWVSFVDGDDFIDPDMYLRLLDNAHNYNADIAHCGYQMVFPSRTDFYYNTGKIVQQNNKQGLVDLLRGDYIEPGLWNKLFRRKFRHQNTVTSTLQTFRIGFRTENTDFTVFSTISLQPFKRFLPIVQTSGGHVNIQRFFRTKFQLSPCTVTIVATYIIVCLHIAEGQICPINLFHSVS